ncbi:c-type cytochrome, methanol metabolism-related [Amaricoccus solimangrovi]|uniref:C-type cytochrome, methanol metabolism-related n=1 Tax=Amaricoccus solimangrovi TaxID=2589815 RepID=A0A501WRQ2_9RHOB|nr:c-type cytochrome, methanol metabolism-related [Amaricoccus solimangrovi]TPE52139.1 c-type cytochrome, methanol metabolism-related [Amaricoccus solimangrovi]
MIHAKSASIALSALAALGLAQAASAQEVKLTPEQIESNITADHEVDGKWFTKEDIPTFKVQEDGTVDWYTFSGFRRYNSECFVCHGPDGQGSTYAPALAKSMLRLDYYDVLGIVAGGKQQGNLVMPSFGDNKNVMCYLDDIYVYLKAMGMDAIPRGRPAKRADKPDAYKEQEDACMG